MTHPRYWTDADLAILHAHYPAGGVAAVQPKLSVHRTGPAINEMARRRGLVVANHKDYDRYQPSDTVDAAIRRAYQSGKRGAVKELANRLGREYGWIKWRAAALGVRRPAGRMPNWTPQEDAILVSLEGKSLTTMQRALSRAGFQRSQAAIQGRVYRTGLSLDDPDTLTAHGIAQILCIDSHTPLRWIRAGALTARRYHQSLTGETGDAKAWRIKRGALRNFIRDHPTEVDLRKVNQLLFLELMLGAPRRWEREESA